MVHKANEQQAEYLAKVASGKRLEDIAREGYVSFPTVRYQLNGLKASMNADTLPQLVAKGIQQRIIKADDNGGFVPSNAPNSQQK